MSRTLKISFIAIGGELLSGRVLESNSFWLQQQIDKRGMSLLQTWTIHDDKATIIANVKRLSEDSDIIVMCGGLGPTDDDITREALAEAAGKELHFHEDSWKNIEARYARRGKTPGPSNRKQAMRIDGSEALANENGTAPGIKMAFNDCWIYVFPGVPHEYKKMANQYFLCDYPETKMELPILKLTGIGESDLTDLIHRENAIPKDMEWGTIARADALNIRFSAESVAHPEFEKTFARLQELLQDHIFAKEELTPQECLIRALLEKEKTIATAESCTGGQLASMLTATPGSSAYLIGSLVAYQNNIKSSALKVSEETLNQHGAVSVECATEMAKGALTLFKTDIAVAITGIAGPGGGTPEKPVGTVCLAAASSDGRLLTKLHGFPGDRTEVRLRSCHMASLMAFSLLK